MLQGSATLDTVTGTEAMEAEIRATLAQVYTPEGVDVYMKARLSYFEGATVGELIAAGRGDEVLTLIDALATGAVL